MVQVELLIEDLALLYRSKDDRHVYLNLVILKYQGVESGLMSSIRVDVRLYKMPLKVANSKNIILVISSEPMYINNLGQDSLSIVIGVNTVVLCYYSMFWTSPKMS